MLLGQELLVLKITDEITATQFVTDAQKHPFIAQPEHVGRKYPRLFQLQAFPHQSPDGATRRCSPSP